MLIEFFCIAFVTGAYGYLFPGIINLLLGDLYGKRHIKPLLGILFIALLFEFLYSYNVITFCHWVIQNNSWIVATGYAYCILLGASLFLKKQTDSNKEIKWSLGRGVIAIVVHPQQITFWLSVYVLFSDKLKTQSEILTFTIISLLGSLAIFLLYVFYSDKLIERLKINKRMLTKIVGFVYLTGGLWGLGQLLLNRN